MHLKDCDHAKKEWRCHTADRKQPYRINNGDVTLQTANNPTEYTMEMSHCRQQTTLKNKQWGCHIADSKQLYRINKWRCHTA
jgi:hypothetical protein